jgi:hypothetical protein
VVRALTWFVKVLGLNPSRRTSFPSYIHNLYGCTVTGCIHPPVAI